MEYPVKAPRIGEAVHTVTIVKYLKAVGDRVRQDEPIVTLETHKTAVDVESPVAGILKSILYAEGDVVPVGEAIMVISAEAQKNDTAICASAAPSDRFVPAQDTVALRNWLGRQRNGSLSPRDRAYCAEHNVIPVNFRKDIGATPEGSFGKDGTNSDAFEDKAIAPQQITLNRTLSESQQQTVTANVQILCDNTPIDIYRRRLRQLGGNVIPSRLEIIGWGVVQALRQHPAFCSRLLGESVLRRFKNPHLGIALALPDDGLTTAVVHSVFSLAFEEFCKNLRKSLDEAKADDYITGYHCLSISDLSTYGAISGVPTLASPAVGTLLVGKPYSQSGDKHLFNLSLSFDHRIANGVGAIRFLNAIRKHIETFK